MEIRLGALDSVVECELADAENFQIQFFGALAPTFAIDRIGILEEFEIQNFSDDPLKFLPAVSSMNADQNTKATT